MEKQIALVRKADQRVDNVIVVDSVSESAIKSWATDLLDAVPVKDSTPYVHGLWDGKEFHAPENEYLVSIGLVSAITDEA